MHRLLGFLRGAPAASGRPRAPGEIAWRPIKLAAAAALLAMAIYEGFKYFAQ